MFVLKINCIGEVEVHGTEDAYKGIELIRVHKLSKDTTLAEVENLFSTQFHEGKKGYKNPKQCVGKITIRAKRENGEIVFLE
ncbi:MULTISPECIES: hypothetical protein [unclassified Lysinibacillus]|uniref:hypothetical protein n=1 Tax=unclassified Lysinibacillus TaxID=2636778 RepID=UPI00382E8A72